MKRTVLITSVVGLAISAILYMWVVSQPPPPSTVDAEKLVRAVHAYNMDLQARGSSPGARVSLRQLIGSGYLSADDVSGFDGMEVYIDVDIDETRPKAVTLRVHMTDGQILELRGDGSVQPVAK